MVLLVEMEGVARLIEELDGGFCGDGVRLCSIVTVCVVVVVSLMASRMIIEEKRRESSFFTFKGFNQHFNTST